MSPLIGLLGDLEKAWDCLPARFGLAGVDFVCLVRLEKGRLTLSVVVWSKGSRFAYYHLLKNPHPRPAPQKKNMFLLHKGSIWLIIFYFLVVLKQLAASGLHVWPADAGLLRGSWSLLANCCTYNCTYKPLKCPNMVISTVITGS